MSARDASDHVKADPTTVQRSFLILAALFFAMAILGLVGEVLGWWNDAGEVMVTVGTLGGLILTAATYTTGTTEDKVARVHGAVVDNGRKLDKLEKLDGLDRIQGELDRQTGVMDRQVQLLGQIRDRL